MRNLKGKKLADSVSSVGSMLLFLIFAVCSLIIILTGANTYSRISGDYRSTFNSSSAVRYITNKIRSCDRAELSDDGKTIYVFSDNTVCVITGAPDGIYERTSHISAASGGDPGDLIFGGTSLSITRELDGLYRIGAYSDDGDFSAYCRRKEG